MDATTRPMAARLRRPGWKDPRLVVGLLLIGIAVAGTALAVKSAERTAPVYAARDTLVPGTVLEPEMLVVVEVRVGSGYLGAPDDAPWGAAVTRTVGAGELVPAAAVVEPGEFDGRPVAVTVAQPLAAGIVPGVAVDVWVTPEDGTPSRLVGESLPVADVDREGGAFGADGQTVYVVVPAPDVGDLLDELAVDGTVAVVGMG